MKRPRHPVTILRKKCELRQKEFADLIGCSLVYLQKIEQTPRRGGKPLSAKLAQSIWHETGVSLEWLRKGDPKAPPFSARGEPYKKEIFVRAQAEKKYYDRPAIPFYLNSDALRYCARVVAILQSAAKHEKYYSAEWEMGAALDKLQKNYGQGPGTEFTDTQANLLKPLIKLARDPIAVVKREIRRFNAALRPSKRPSKKERRPVRRHRS